MRGIFLPDIAPCGCSWRWKAEFSLFRNCHIFQMHVQLLSSLLDSQLWLHLSPPGSLLPDPEKNPLLPPRQPFDFSQCGQPHSAGSKGAATVGIFSPQGTCKSTNLDKYFLERNTTYVLKHKVERNVENWYHRWTHQVTPDTLNVTTSLQTLLKVDWEWNYSCIQRDWEQHFCFHLFFPQYEPQNFQFFFCQKTQDVKERRKEKLRAQ